MAHTAIGYFAISDLTLGTIRINHATGYVLFINADIQHPGISIPCSLLILSLIPRRPSEVSGDQNPPQHEWN